MRARGRGRLERRGRRHRSTKTKVRAGVYRALCPGAGRQGRPARRGRPKGWLHRPQAVQVLKTTRTNFGFLVLGIRGTCTAPSCFARRRERARCLLSIVHTAPRGPAGRRDDGGLPNVTLGTGSFSQFRRTGGVQFCNKPRLISRAGTYMSPVGRRIDFFPWSPVLYHFPMWLTAGEGGGCMPNAALKKGI